MKNLKNLIIGILVNTYSFSADPNLFGAKQRREEKQRIAKMFLDESKKTQADIDELRTRNPFEGAAAKEAMKKASRTTRQWQKRNMNIMGDKASPEAIIASQGAANEAVGSAAGKIAAGAEANRDNKESRLLYTKDNQMRTFGQIATGATDEIGSDFDTLFKAIDSLGSVSSGAGQAAGTLMLM